MTNAEARTGTTDQATANQWLRESVAQIFPNDVDRITYHCTHHLDYPLGYNHPDILLEILGTALPRDVVQRLRLGYVLLSAYYFLLDAVVDGHLEDSDDALYLTHLLAGAHAMYAVAAQQERPSASDDVHRIVFKYVAENAAAIRLEKQLNASPLEVQAEEDYISAVGRSNSVLMFYEIAALLTGATTDAGITREIGDIVYAIQLGDDLADWRVDYEGGRWTSSLRRCFAHAGRMLTLEEVETEILLGGFFESQTAEIVNRLRDVLARMERRRDAGSEFLRALVEAHCAKYIRALTDVVELKLSAQTGHARNA